MPRQKNRAFVHPLLAATLAVIGAGGLAGLGAVWLRHQIAETGNQVRTLEGRLASAERALAETRLQITDAESVDRLERRNTDWRLGLVPPSEPQVVLVTPADEGRLAAQRAGGGFREFPVIVALDSASAAHRSR